MAKLQEKCPYCGKVAKEVSRTPDIFAANNEIVEFECGHSIVIEKAEALAEYDLEFEDGRKLFPFQAETLKFIHETANYRAGIFHDMGLGKTIIAIGAMKLNPDLSPVLIICKSALKVQWFKEIFKLLKKPAQIIEGRDQPAFNLFDIFIVSYDLLRNVWGKDENWIERDGDKFQLVILDECQAIKNHNSKRTNNVRRLCAGKSKILALSGTPIKNHALEYFPILNILNPTLFYSQRNFQTYWVDSYWDGYKYRIGGLSNPDAFRERTKSFIIRYQREEVMKDLPVINTQYTYHDLGKKVQKEYDKVYNKFMEEYNPEMGFTGQDNILAYMQRMKQLTGVAKVNPVIDYLEDFLENRTDKIVLFVHHHSVADLIKMHVDHLCKDKGLAESLELSADLTPEKRDEVVTQFIGRGAGNEILDPKTDPRILIASTLSSGEGLDGLQKASSICMMVEQQWNSANEEQAEKRLSRYGSNAKHIDVIRPIAIGTIDEFLAELKEKKRSAIAQTLDGKEYIWTESSIMKELADMMFQKGKKAWKLPC